MKKFAEKFQLKATKINVFILIVLISGCSKSSDNGNLTYHCDMDDQIAWNRNPVSNIIAISDAPSGRYVSEINEGSPYSVTLSMRLNQVSVKLVEKISVKAKVKISDIVSDPVLVIDIIDKDGVSLEWIPVGIRDKSDSINKWQELSNGLDMSVNGRNNPDNSIKVYVSNGFKQSALVDDIEVIFEN